HGEILVQPVSHASRAEASCDPRPVGPADRAARTSRLVAAGRPAGRIAGQIAAALGGWQWRSSVVMSPELLEPAGMAPGHGAIGPGALPDGAGLAGPGPGSGRLRVGRLVPVLRAGAVASRFPGRVRLPDIDRLRRPGTSPGPSAGPTPG